ncbi:uncharacterized protein LOC120322169 [Drosophila yakuba]|uniref:uncharacterized protein LOC120322169 n=1 Tax=Drosophila yakuba TaxID=7245 RepID=UPI0019307F50|nr:uncharacterized protein LOC120322169 [Drosophila yakuba]
MQCIPNLCKQIADYWTRYDRKESSVLKYKSDWLNQNESIPVKNISKKYQQRVQSPHRGRQKLDFEESSARTKRRRIAHLAELDESAISSLRTECEMKNILPADPDEVISLLMETAMSKNQYLLIRNFVNSKISFDFFPCYKRILNSKKKRYPENISVDESHAEVELQSLLDNTASSILELQANVVETVNDDSIENLVLIGKWGFDGSTGHSEYKQKFSNNDLDDKSLFVTSYVPLQLISKSGNKIIWKNPRPSSTRYCRPIRFQFQKETSQLSINEERYFKEKINLLKRSVIFIHNRNINVEHSLQLTMVDGKVCNALTESSSAKCYICGANPKEMNDLDKCLNKVVNKEHFEFGLSPLHAKIRFFEYFLHISYKSSVKMWQVRDPEKKLEVMKRKQKIQKEFREKMGLIVDKPRDGGRGSSNDGNVARKFFSNPKLASDITGIDENLIHRCATILQAIASGYKINAKKFNEYALETAKQLTKKYS